MMRSARSPDKRNLVPFRGAATLALVTAWSLARVASANLPVFLPLSDQSFNLTLGGALPMKVSELHDKWARNIKDPNRPTPQDADLWLEYVSAFSSVADYLIVDDYFKQHDNGDESEARRKEVLAQLEKEGPSLLKAHFDKVAQEHGARRVSRADITELRLDDGIGFYADFLGTGTPEERLLARAFVLNPANARVRSGDEATAFYRSVIDPKAHVRILDRSRLSPAEWQTLGGFLDTAPHTHVMTHGDYVVMGEGLPFLETNAIVEQGMGLKDAALRAKFERVLRFTARKGLPIGQGNQQGAAAFFNPADYEFDFVTPYAANLNSFTHEITHARFSKLMDQLKRWLARKNWVLPYELDGPSRNALAAALGVPGGLMTLLNEVNSYRVGNSFDGKSDLAGILKFVLDHYSAEVGAEAVDEFSGYWNPATIGDRSVARVLIDTTRKLNQLDDPAMLQMGGEGLTANDHAKQFDFLRLAAVRFRDKPVPDAVSRLKQRMAAESKYGDVREQAGAAGTAAPDPAAEAKRLDAQGFPAVWEGFRKNPTPELHQLLSEKYLAQFGPAETKGLFELSLARKYATDPMSPVLPLLGEVLDQQGITSIYASDPLGSLRAVQARMNAANHLPAGFAMPEARTSDQKFALLTPEFDAWLAGAMFDGQPGAHRMAVMDVIRSRTFPSDLPVLFKRLTSILNDPKLNENDGWLARAFLMPQSSQVFATDEPWGKAAARAIMESPQPLPAMTRQLGEFYRVTLPLLLSGNPALDPHMPRDGKMREQMLVVLAQMTPTQKSDYQQAIDHLWALLRSQDALTRSSAMYALADYPMYLLSLEGKLRTLLSAGPSDGRDGVVRLMSAVSPGFLPSLDQAVTGVRLTPEEEVYLRTRLPNSVTRPWCTPSGLIRALQATR